MEHDTQGKIIDTLVGFQPWLVRINYSLSAVSAFTLLLAVSGFTGMASKPAYYDYALGFALIAGFFPALGLMRIRYIAIPAALLFIPMALSNFEFIAWNYSNFGT